MYNGSYFVFETFSCAKIYSVFAKKGLAFEEFTLSQNIQGKGEDGDLKSHVSVAFHYCFT
jgi:hypothetical protein